jgi:hypothetical protein
VGIASAQTDEKSGASSSVSCSDIDAYNVRTKAMCAEKNGTISQKQTEKGCTMYMCTFDQSSAAPKPATLPPLPPAMSDECKALREKAATLTGDELAALKQQWMEKCEPKKPSVPPPPPVSNCDAIRQYMSTLDQTSDAYAMAKKKWTELCGQKQENTSASSVSADQRVQCWKMGCAVKCEDGTAYNVCSSVTPNRSVPKPILSGSNSSSSVRCESIRSGFCIVKKCSDGKMTKICTRGEK